MSIQMYNKQMKTFSPALQVLPPPQLKLWHELDGTPGHFVLYGGTGLALHLGHRVSVDFDFFSNQAFDPQVLAQSVPYLTGAERVQIAANTLTCRVGGDEGVLVSFFGGLGLARVAPIERVEGRALRVASVLDIAGTKAAVVQKRAEKKDYLDIDAVLQSGIALPEILAAARAIYGNSFNPLITLKALSYFGDIPDLPNVVQERLRAAVAGVDPLKLPVIKPFDRG
ncbi:nucleotidyl transferase AbiEii/AbiGii toxin family protein [Desulfofustis limnaeus]|uniref:nucleotidyl transferase AbiEii/AbiGii toxin family protein n=1 Tax=Desulfofustis limnaeus TaxID=2740163 RepID=UPI0024DF92B6|nr:nucleotidyl transferase AbiEii/AbiGii toxin family protein [Desulfofustis limnaeus]